MLDFIYYPISAVLWFWHKVFGFVLGPDSGLSWALAIIFLVVTIRSPRSPHHQAAALQPQDAGNAAANAGDP